MVSRPVRTAPRAMFFSSSSNRLKFVFERVLTFCNFSASENEKKKKKCLFNSGGLESPSAAARGPRAVAGRCGTLVEVTAQRIRVGRRGRRGGVEVKIFRLIFFVEEKTNSKQIKRKNSHRQKEKTLSVKSATRGACAACLMYPKPTNRVPLYKMRYGPHYEGTG